MRQESRCVNKTDKIDMKNKRRFDEMASTIISKEEKKKR